MAEVPIPEGWCGVPSPWGTVCSMDDDHNDHTHHSAPRWWRTDTAAIARAAQVQVLRETADRLEAVVPDGDGDSVLAMQVGFATGAMRARADELEGGQR